MKNNIICKAGYIVFTILFFALCRFLPELSDLFFRIWYIVSIIVWCALAIELLSLSLKHSKSKRSKGRKEKRK